MANGELYKEAQMPVQETVTKTVSKTGETAVQAADTAVDVAKSTGSAMHNVLLAGIGAVAMGVDRLEAMSERFVERGRQVEQEGWGIANARKQADKTAASLRSATAEQRSAMLKQMGVASSDDMAEIKERLDALAPQDDAAADDGETS